MGDKLSRAPLRLQPFASPISLVGAIERIAAVVLWSTIPFQCLVDYPVTG